MAPRQPGRSHRRAARRRLVGHASPIVRRTCPRHFWALTVGSFRPVLPPIYALFGRTTPRLILPEWGKSTLVLHSYCSTTGAPRVPDVDGSYDSFHSGTDTAVFHTCSGSVYVRYGNDGHG